MLTLYIYENHMTTLMVCARVVVRPLTKTKTNHETEIWPTNSNFVWGQINALFSMLFDACEEVPSMNSKQILCFPR